MFDNSNVAVNQFKIQQRHAQLIPYLETNYQTKFPSDNEWAKLVLIRDLWFHEKYI